MQIAEAPKELLKISVNEKISQLKRTVMTSTNEAISSLCGTKEAYIKAKTELKNIADFLEKNQNHFLDLAEAAIKETEFPHGFYSGKSISKFQIIRPYIHFEFTDFSNLKKQIQSAIEDLLSTKSFWIEEKKPDKYGILFFDIIKDSEKHDIINFIKNDKFGILVGANALSSGTIFGFVMLNVCLVERNKKN